MRKQRIEEQGQLAERNVLGSVLEGKGGGRTLISLL